MEYHCSPPNLSFIFGQRARLQECMIAALLSNGLYVETLVEQKVSDTKTHYWARLTHDGSITAEALDQIKNFKGSYLEHLKEYAYLYSLYTSIPPDQVMLVETIKVGQNQVSSTWQFKKMPPTQPDQG